MDDIQACGVFLRMVESMWTCFGTGRTFLEKEFSPYLKGRGPEVIKKMIKRRVRPGACALLQQKGGFGFSS
ncbi:MAG: hypothetical protein Q3X95_04660 [Duodenibacillus sp.]|nr:hypothetical protein [Duodenibacillus sp.]